MAHHGFEMSVEKGAYDQPLALHGREYSEGVRQVTWSGGVVEDWAYDEFIIFGRIGNVESGETLYFKTTQKCGADKSVVWGDIPADGDDHPAKPAPSLKITAKEIGHDAHAGHNHGAAHDAPEKHGDMVMAGDLHIEKAWTRATPANAMAGGAFLSITNKGDKADRLLSAKSDVAKVVEVHEMSMVKDVMKMQQLVDGLPIEPGQTVELKPGGFHLMLIGLHNPIAQDQMVKITLQFEHAGEVDVMFPAAQMGAPSMDHSNH
jgi:copper(I)-binding protein